MKFLIIQTAFLGDAVLATALIEKLHDKFPNEDIDFLVRKGNEGLFRDHPKIHQLIVFDKKTNKYGNLIRLIKSIRKQRYDHVINVQRFFTTGLITILSGGKEKIGFRKNPLSFAFNISVEHQLNIKGSEFHEVERNQALIKHLTDHKVGKPRLYPSKSDFEKVLRMEPYVCLAPASVWFTKQVPAEKWIELIKSIPSNYDILLIGSPADVSLCERIASNSERENIEILAGKHNLLESAALISKARMTFANDSAPVHLASAMNAPVSELYCSTIPEFGFGPLSDESYTFEVKQKLECRPCGLHGRKNCPLGHFKCSNLEIDSILKQTNL